MLTIFCLPDLEIYGYSLEVDYHKEFGRLDDSHIPNYKYNKSNLTNTTANI